MWQYRREEVGRMLRAMRTSAGEGKPVAVAAALMNGMANMIGLVILSKRLFEEEGSGSKEFKDLVVEHMTLAGQFNVGDFFPWLAPLDLQGLERQMRHLHKRFDAMLGRMVAEHAETQGQRQGRPDLLDAFMARLSAPEEGKLTLDNIKALLTVRQNILRIQ